MDRRDFLAGAGLLAVAPTASSAARGVDWGAVRREFRLDPALTNLGLFYLASNPREVRDAVDEFRRRLDSNSHDLMPEEAREVAVALGQYVGGAADDIAFVPNTTIGLSIVYGGLKLRAGQELLLNDQDHAWHQQAARLAAGRVGANVRVGTLFENPAKATEDEIATRLRNSITPRTRAVGITWVQSSTGVRMPVRACASVVAEANRGRAREDRCLLVVDGVHGLAAVDDDAARMGADVFVAGTHKWLFGPRGTGMVWVNPEVSDQIVPLLPSLSDRSPTALLGPGGFHAFEQYYAVRAAVRFHQRRDPRSRRPHAARRLGLRGHGVLRRSRPHRPRAGGTVAAEKHPDHHGVVPHPVRAGRHVDPQHPGGDRPDCAGDQRAGSLIRGSSAVPGGSSRTLVFSICT
ncbi:aminotransferase class V-fold PLP-dependent enzyme [Lentzea sp. HUAS12]|uniref:aminotransferase class V-fold PLP-dependent enzyme n=1 Tax=Lentzea sp. HUAS12 TaxID=2951806 RepID=UPI00209E4A52|nr:aminotransferase class V-fold PLP-dependent enzyme [Lentzea sp. HUAS12]USX51871.1 aminotransferase class V-fold PLP-dependent enzyme [Lentzea sp. HUAS12]